MKPSSTGHSRILAIAPSTRGFGYAVLEGENKLVDWGVKTVSGDKNVQSLDKVAELITHYQPEQLVVPNYRCRSDRICELIDELLTLASNCNIALTLVSIKQVKERVLGTSNCTKHGLAEIIAKEFPEELGFRLPPKRRAWTSEDSRMDMFIAVASGIGY